MMLNPGDPYRRNAGPEVWTFVRWDAPRDRLVFENDMGERLDMPYRLAQARGMLR